MLLGLRSPRYSIITSIADRPLPLTYSHRGLSGRKSMDAAMMLEDRSCSHTGTSHVRSSDRFRDPRTAPLAVIAPVHLRDGSWLA